MTADATLASPCVGVCLLDLSTGRCRGCLRTTTEIANWYDANAAEKRVILARLVQRRLELGDPQ